jgi:anti-sigma factor RsiW
MGEGVILMKSLRCWLLRASLVDFAEGRLGEEAREPIERHVANCIDCAGAVLSLREVPAELRRLAAREPREEFWARQRAGIVRAIADSRTARPREQRTAARAPSWTIAAPMAASVVMVLIASQWWSPSKSVERARSIPTNTVVASSTESSPDYLFEADETSFAMSETDDVDELGALFEDAAI